MSSSRKKRPFLLRRLPFSCIFPVFSWFWTILAKNIRDSLSRINKSLIRFWMWVNVGKEMGGFWSKSIKIALLDPWSRSLFVRYHALNLSSASIFKRRLYLATLSERLREPVLICPQFVATARSAIVVSSVSPERCDTMAL